MFGQSTIISAKTFYSNSKNGVDVPEYMYVEYRSISSFPIQRDAEKLKKWLAKKQY